MKRFFVVLLTTTAIALSSFLMIAFSQDRSELANDHKVVHRLRNDNDEEKNKDAHTSNGKPKPGNGISYHGGPLLGVVGQAPVYAYYIWYGNWSGNTATTILTDLANSIGGSPYFNINTTYYNGAGAHVVHSVTLRGSTTDSHS